jgi:predicted nucleic acid-binding Zn ribbon protein
MKESLASREKCSSCGQPIPDDEASCPNCGRKRKTPVTALAYPIAAKPIVAQFCTAFAWLALIFGPMDICAGIFDSASGLGAGLQIYVGVFSLLASLVLFAVSRGITLLAQIERNTRRSS